MNSPQSSVHQLDLQPCTPSPSFTHHSNTPSPPLQSFSPFVSTSSTIKHHIHPSPHPPKCNTIITSSNSESIPQAPCYTYHTWSLHMGSTQSVLLGLTLDLAFHSETSDMWCTIIRTCSKHSSHDEHFKRDKRKRNVLEQDDVLNENWGSKWVNTGWKQTKKKEEENYNAKCSENKEDILLWSHFNDWDWDTILAHHPKDWPP